MNDDIATDATNADAAAHVKARTAAADFIGSTQLASLYTPQAAERAVDLLETMLMRTWHEGVIAGLDAALARIRA